MSVESHAVVSAFPLPNPSTALASTALGTDPLAVDASTTTPPAIHMMPPELLQLVLEHLVIALFSSFWDGADSDCSVGPDELWLVPMRLAAVCRDWRSIALATPSLWNRIIVIVASIFEARLEGYAAALQLQLDRARAQPMRLLLVVDFEAPFPNQSDMAGVDTFVDVVKRVVQRSAQVTVMYIRGSDAEPVPDAAARLQNLFETDTRALKRMIVAMINDDDDDEVEDAPPGLVDMPFAQSVASIKSLVLASIIPRIPDNMVFSSLQELEIDVDQLLTSSIVRLLEVSPQLQRLTLRTCSIEEHRLEPISHSTLTFLHIQVQKLSSEIALQAYRLPALKHAIIVFDILTGGERLTSDNDEISSTHKRDLIWSVCRGANNLGHLAIRYTEADEQLASVLLGLGLRQLETLELEGCILYAGFGGNLVTNTNAFPCLSEIRCSETVPSRNSHDNEVSRSVE